MPRVIKRSGPDRRRELDRRQVYDIRHFGHGGIERRGCPEQRTSRELRKGWVRITQWSSIFLGCGQVDKNDDLLSA